MSDDQSQNNGGSSTKKGFFSALYSHLFHGELKNREDLVELIRDSEQNDLIDTEIREMLEGVMDISEQRVRDIMIPRAQMITLNINQSLEASIKIIVDSAHSRFPIFSQDKDQIEGILLAKDLLPYLNSHSEPFSIEKVLRPAVVVPEGKRVDHMLKEFRQQRYHMAIVVDEFGNVSGLVTIEDILELIVGEIDDEYDDDEDIEIRRLNDNTYAVNALTSIEDFNEIFASHFSDSDVDTIGGLVMQFIGHLPKYGESVMIDGYQFKVSVADHRQVIQVQVKVPETALKPELD